MKTTIFLALIGFILMAYGAACFVNPEMLASMAGVTANNAEGLAELRSMYGGVQIGIGAFYCLCACYQKLKAPGLLLHVMLFSVIAICRTAAIALDGASFIPLGAEAGFNVKALFLFEIPVVLIGLWLYNAKPTEKDAAGA